MKKITRRTFLGLVTLLSFSCTVEEPEILWEYDTGNEPVSSLAIGHDGTIYYIEEYDQPVLVALSPSGTLKWRFEPESSGYASIPSIGSDGTIYFSFSEGFVFAVNTEGTLKWQQETGNGEYGAGWPAIASDGTIYVGATDGNLYAFSAGGNQVWMYERASTPVIGSDGTLYCIRSFPPNSEPYDYSDTLIALNPNGTPLWEYEAGGRITTSAAIGSDGTLYFGVTPDYDEPPIEESYLYALGPDADLKWKFKLEDDLIEVTPIIDADGNIYTGSYLKFYSLTPEGTLRWGDEFKENKNFPSLYFRHPIITSDGSIYFGSNSRYLYAVDSEGNILHEYRLPKGISYVVYPTIAEDGILYFQIINDDGTYLYSISTESKGLASSPWPAQLHDNQNTGRAE
ncbi:PQQ-like beta-propeller repeat protein [candidate division WOR-3 bacterium]|nr:PQQ-like beta-propeller repeat protein [candidate division WOR-3 bacterium]